MNVHGLKQKKKALRRELQEELEKQDFSKFKIRNLQNKIKGICRQIRERKG